MTLSSLTVNLLVPDVNATVEYYREILGFELSLGVLEGTQDTVFETTEARLGFAMMRNGPIELMFQSHASVADDLPGFAPGSGDAVSLYFDAEDVEAQWEALRDRVEVVKELATTFYGAREFYFRDPNGFVIGLARRAASAG